MNYTFIILIIIGIIIFFCKKKKIEHFEDNKCLNPTNLNITIQLLWQNYYRRKINQNTKFPKVTLWQQIFWFVFMCLSGIIGQILFRIYFNAFDIQIIWYLGFVFLFQPFLKYFLIFSIISAFFLAFGCFWALPIHSKIDNNLPFPLDYLSNSFNNILFEPFLDKKYQFGYKYSPPFTIQRESFDDFYNDIVSTEINVIKNSDDYDSSNIFTQALDKSQKFNDSLENTAFGIENTKYSVDRLSSNTNDFNTSLSNMGDNIPYFAGKSDETIAQLDDINDSLGNTETTYLDASGIIEKIMTAGDELKLIGKNVQTGAEYMYTILYALWNPLDTTWDYLTGWI